MCHELDAYDDGPEPAGRTESPCPVCGGPAEHFVGGGGGCCSYACECELADAAMYDPEECRRLCEGHGPAYPAYPADGEPLPF